MAARKKKRIRAPQKSPANQQRPETPSKPDKGKDGKFLPGNGLSFAVRPEAIGGNPLAGALQRYRTALDRVVSAPSKKEAMTRFERIADRVVALAEDGTEWAVKEVFGRLMGRIKDIEDDGPPPPPPPSGDVTINTQVNNIGPAALPPAVQDRMAHLIQLGIQALQRDKMLDAKEP